MSTPRRINEKNIARLVKKGLTRTFPGVKFYVSSKIYGNGSANIHIGWVDGPTEPQVTQICKPFVGQDNKLGWLWHDTVTYDEKPDEGAERVTVETCHISPFRHYSREFCTAVVAHVTAKTGWDTPEIQDITWYTRNIKRGSAVTIVDDTTTSRDPNRQEQIVHFFKVLREARVDEIEPVEKVSETPKSDVLPYEIEFERKATLFRFHGKPDRDTVEALGNLGARNIVRKRAFVVYYVMELDEIEKLMGSAPVKVTYPEPEPLPDEPEYTSDGKVKMCRIKILGGETPSDFLGTFETWEEVRDVMWALRQYRLSVDPKFGWYHKTDFEVVYTDGEVYAGRVDVGDSSDDWDIGAHMANHLTFYTGERQPDWMTEQQYREIVERDPDTRREVQEWLDTYQIVQYTGGQHG